MSMNLLEKFGVSITVPEEKKAGKKESAKKETKKDAKKSASKKKEDTKHALPVSVSIPYCGTVTLIPDMVDGKESLTSNEIEEAVRGMEEYSFLSKVAYGFKEKVKKNSRFAFFYKAASVVSKGILELNAGCTARIGNTIYNIPAGADYVGMHVDELREYLSKEEKGLAMADFIYDDDANVLHIVPAGKVLDKPELVLKGVKTFDGTGTVPVTLDGLKELWKKSGNDESSFKISYLLVKDFIDTKTECSDLCVVGESMIIAIEKPEEVQAGKSEGKVYEVKDVVVSFGYDSFVLSDVANGREKLTEDELKTIIEIRHPEYGKDRTRIIYDEKLKMVIPQMTGGTKGCVNALLPAVTMEEAEEFWDSSKTGLVILTKEGKQYRVEKTPVLKVAASMNGNGKGAARLVKGKISKRIYEVIERFFVLWTMEHDCEVMVQLYYNMEKEEVFIHLPEQEVSKAAIHYTLPEKLQTGIAKGEVFPLADIHSHGKIMAFFSQVDNRDEKATRLFGVFGGMTRLGHMSFCVRAGAGGHFVNMEPSDVFDNDTFENKFERDRLANVLLEKAEQSVSFS